jgi:G3E family GTPase
VADRLLLSKTDLARPDPALLADLDRLNPWADRLSLPSAADPATLLFGVSPRLERPAPEAAAAHTDGITTCSLILRRPPTRFAFARVLGRLASDRGEDLLRAKGLIAFADRPDRVAIIHAVQHTISNPHWLEAWPDADARSRMVFITRAIAGEEILARFAEFDPVPWTARARLVADAAV